MGYYYSEIVEAAAAVVEAVVVEAGFQLAAVRKLLIEALTFSLCSLLVCGRRCLLVLASTTI
jgi:hypothetical protein